MCVIYVHVYVSAPGHVSASVCAQMHMCACAWGHSKIGFDVYFASGDRVSHCCVHRCTCVYCTEGTARLAVMSTLLFVTGSLTGLGHTDLVRLVGY